jgi:hypothetical protein
MRNLESRGSFPSRYDSMITIYCAYESTQGERVPRYPTPVWVLADESSFDMRQRADLSVGVFRFLDKSQTVVRSGVALVQLENKVVGVGR